VHARARLPVMNTHHGGPTSTQSPPPVFRLPSRGESPVYLRCDTPPKAMQLTMLAMMRASSRNHHRRSASAHEMATFRAAPSDAKSTAVVEERGGANCPICLDPIFPHEDIVTLGCAHARPNSTPHQMHCTPCLQQWLNSTDVVSGVVCPVCRDVRSQLTAMTPGGAHRLSGGVCILEWP